MKKTLCKLMVVMMLVLALIPNGIAYAQPSTSDGIVYNNQILGFSLTLPASWEGRYSVYGSLGNMFIHTASRDKTDAGLLFYIQRFDELPLSEGALGGAGERHLVTQLGMFSYILVYPSGVEYTDETKAEYMEMTADIADILKTVSAIPITGEADPTYQAGGKVNDDNLTDNFIYAFAKGTKDAAPGDCLLMIDGQFTDWHIIIKNGRSFVPLLAVTEALGIPIFGDKNDSIAITGANRTEVIMKIGETQASVNGKHFMLDAAPFVENDRVYLPLRFLCEHLGKAVGYIPADVSNRSDVVGVAGNPVVWVDDLETTNKVKNLGGNPPSWLRPELQKGLVALKANLETAHRGFLTEPYYTKEQIESTLAEIQTAIDNTEYVGQIGRYAMFRGPYNMLVDVDANVIYFYSTAHSLATIRKADMSNPDTYVPMYFAD